MRKGQVIGNSLIVLGVILLIIGIMMPYYKVPQRLSGKGPGVQFSDGVTYWIKTYIVPPIDKGRPVNLNLLSDKPGRTSVILAPFDPQTGTILGPPLVNVIFANNQKGIVVFTNASRTGPYMLIVTSYNSSYTFYLDSVWSPYYELRASTTFGIAIVPIGLVVLYYDSIVERRERMFEAALKGIKKTVRTEHQ